jgi:hypothetical protein
MVSQADPESRHARKNRHALIDGGYQAHLSAEPSTGIITDEELTMASGGDNSDAAAARFVAREHDGSGQVSGGGRGEGVPGDGNDGQLIWYADSAYGTGELRPAIGQAGDQAVIKPKPHKRAVEGGFTVDDFTVDHQADTATCPAGTTRRITPAGSVNFGAPGRTARCAAAAPPPRPARSCTSASMTSGCARPAATGPAPLRRDYSRPGHRSGAPSPTPPLSAAGASNSGAAAPRKTTPGSNAAPPPSTCAPCSGTAWPAATAPGPSPQPPPAPRRDQQPAGGPGHPSTPPEPRRHSQAPHQKASPGPTPEIPGSRPRIVSTTNPPFSAASYC